VGAQGPYLPRFPAPGLHPHPPKGYFGMSSRNPRGSLPRLED
jgi:hypothetical protein